MMKKLLLILVAALFAAPVFAQKPMPRSEISVSYGIAPATTWVDAYSNIFTGLFIGQSSELDAWGAVTVGYNYRLTKNFSIGAQAVYASNRTTFEKTPATIDHSYWSVMPNVKWSWINLRIVSFYSRVGLGATFSHSKIEGAAPDGVTKGNETEFAFQVSPIGIEVGGNLAGYAEAGIGNSGSLLVGLRYRF